MANLNYQRGDEAAREDWQRLRLKLFGPGYREVWSVLAEEIGGTYRKRRWTMPDRIDVSVGKWQLTLDVYSDGENAYTRMRAPYVNADGFRFLVFRKHLLSPLAEKLGFQDVLVGHPDFDEAFIIRGTSEHKLQQLFANARLRALLSAQLRVHFEVRDDEGWFHQRFPEGVDELRFMVPGVMKDIDQLKGLFDLFGETLHTLCGIGSARQDDPGVRLER
jgi:hypothetical protein